MQNLRAIAKKKAVETNKEKAEANISDKPQATLKNAPPVNDTVKNKGRVKRKDKSKRKKGTIFSMTT